MSSHPPAHIRRLWACLAIMLIALGACAPDPVALPTPAAAAVAITQGAAASTPAPQPSAASPSTATTPPTLTATLAPSITPTGRPSSPQTSTAPPSTMEVPTPTHAATAKPATTAPAAPAVISFTVTPTTTLKVGDTLSVSWEAVGDKSSLCFIDGTGPVGCEDVPLEGSTTLPVTEATLYHVQLGLKAEAGGTFTWALVNLHFECPDKPWFFANDSGRCAAEPAVHSHAAAQYFEHGFMVWTETPDRFYVFFDKDPATGWQQFIWYEAPYPFGSPVPPEATPPPGLYVPESGFGRIWRGELPGSEDVRQRLGWATGPEFAYETDYQCETPAHPKLWRCYLRGPDGAVLSLQPDSSAQARFLWERQ